MNEERKYCTNCGKEIYESAMFCEFCGTSQKRVEAIKIDKEIPEEIREPIKIDKEVLEEIREPKKNTLLALLVLFIIVSSTLGISTVILGIMHMELETSYNTLMEDYLRMSRTQEIIGGSRQVQQLLMSRALRRFYKEL